MTFNRSSDERRTGSSPLTTGRRRFDVPRFGLVAVLLLAACTGPTAAPPPPSRDTDPNHAPAAITLQELAGQLLLYHSSKRRFPIQLAELIAPPTNAPTALLIDPSSSKPFVYLRNGPSVPGRPGRLMAYQPESEGGWRWALLVDEPPTGQVNAFVEPIADAILRRLVP